VKELQEQRRDILAIIKDPTLTHEQTMMALSSAGRDILELPGDAPRRFYELK